MPLFASYVFVRSRPQDSLSAVRFCPGVLRPLTFAGRLAFVDEELIETLKLKEGDRGHILHDVHASEMSPGRRVRIMDGPLRGVEGVLAGLLRGRQRAKVLIQFLRSEHTVEVDAVGLVGA